VTGRHLGAIHTPAPASIRRLEQVFGLVAAKPETDWLEGIDFGAGPDPMLGNADAGCCVEVSAFQIARIRAHHVWGPDSYLPVTGQVVSLYSARTGYVPGEPATDLGTDTAAFMGWWATAGLPFGNPAADIDVIGWSRASLFRTPMAIDLAGPVRMTLALPAALQDAPASAWADAPGTSADWEAGSWGTHSVAAGAQRDRSLRVVTWGETVWLHPEFALRYWVATDVAVSRFWLTTTGLAPSAVDWASLAADVSGLASA